MKETMILHFDDPDGKIYRAVMEALEGSAVQTVNSISNTILTVGELEIYPKQRQVCKAGKNIHLNYGEFSILYYMAQSPGQVFSREQLYNATWGEDYELGRNTIDNTIYRLRCKLESDPKHPLYIKTVFRIGYKVELL